MAGGRTRYELRVTYAVTRADDIDILAEGEYAGEQYDSAVDALGDLGDFISRNGGPHLWEQVDSQEMGSCWLPDGPGTEISFHAHMDRVTTVDGQPWAQPVDRRPATLTWGRLKAASLGALRRQVDT